MTLEQVDVDVEKLALEGLLVHGKAGMEAKDEDPAGVDRGTPKPSGMKYSVQGTSSPTGEKIRLCRFPRSGQEVGRKRATSVSSVFRARANVRLAALKSGTEESDVSQACILRVDSDKKTLELRLLAKSEYQILSLQDFEIGFLPRRNSFSLSLPYGDSSSATGSADLVLELSFCDSYCTTRMVFTLLLARDEATSLRFVVFLASSSVHHSMELAAMDPSYCPVFFRRHAVEIDQSFPGHGLALTCALGQSP